MAQVVAAARQIAAALAGTVTVRIDPDKRTIPQANERVCRDPREQFARLLGRPFLV